MLMTQGSTAIVMPAAVISREGSTGRHKAGGGPATADEARAQAGRVRGDWAGGRAGGVGAQAATAEDEPDARAMSNLALMAESGKWGRPPDESAALDLYRWVTGAARGPQHGRHSGAFSSAGSPGTRMGRAADSGPQPLPPAWAGASRARSRVVRCAAGGINAR